MGFGELERLDVADTRAPAETADRIRERVTAAPLPRAIREQVMAAYWALSKDVAGEDAGGGGGVDVAVRSSATAEDLPTASFAGQHETYLNIRGEEALDAAVRECMASLFTDRGIVYRVHNKLEHRVVALSVGVQRMVRSDLAPDGCAGTMFTLDTESGHRGVVGAGEREVWGTRTVIPISARSALAVCGHRPRAVPKVS